LAENGGKPHPSAADAPSKRQTGPAVAPDKRPGAGLVPGLYLVATPIGNLGDLTPRGAEILAAADLVACEDTRVTGKLLALQGIRTRLTPYHDHSSAEVRAALIEQLKSGKIVALVSDAGTPLISDPGYRLVRAAVEAGIYVTAAPGPSSPIAALVLSGLPTDRFLFAGYLPPKDKARRDALTELRDIRATLILLESTRRLAPTLAAMADILGDRPVAVARELTKLHEEVRRGTLAALAAAYAAEPAPRGEAVVVVGPPAPAVAAAADDIDALLADALATMSVRDAAAAVAVASGAPRKTVYARALDLSRGATRDPKDPRGGTRDDETGA